MNDYSFDLHRHNYATWTAARAVQRNFTNTKSIKHAINASGLRNFVKSDEIYSIAEFDSFHKFCAQEIINEFGKVGISASYGQAAKIISIYLKTSVIICNSGSCTKSEVIHPPIDRVLLTNIADKIDGLGHLKQVNWTQLSEDSYWMLIKQLRAKIDPFNWRVEEFWFP
ncbi:hypothetical protein J2I47_09250 [Fibrella sp. HMF5335]|uniref:Uncharacterized protein n=1 Tax=Fibrella rubiginis TaxID=2817060 RepID=A0A939K2W0_9BACT|nr:hypothetical protein [Fibrella rubiginis]MBO0936729.1 hypothetical protein [Fibrella rubiginis]